MTHWFRADDAAGRWHRRRPVFAFCARDGRVVDAAPVARRRLLGRRLDDVFGELIAAGVGLVELG